MVQIISYVLLHFSSPAGLCNDVVTVDTDWHKLNLLIGSQRSSPETQTQIWNWRRQQPPRTQVVHCLQTVHCRSSHPVHRSDTAYKQYTAGCPWCVWQNGCILSSSLMTTPCARSTNYEISRNCPMNSIDIPMQTSKALFAANSKLSTNAHFVRICPKDGCERYEVK